MSEEVPKAIREPDAKERAAAAKLSESDLQIIDAEIFKNCSDRWLKAARVVSHAETALADRYPDLSYIIYTYRLSELVEKGRLESQGDIFYIRFSEVRIPVSE